MGMKAITRFVMPATSSLLRVLFLGPRRVLAFPELADRRRLHGADRLCQHPARAGEAA
jgi:hypothetical protein